MAEEHAVVKTASNSNSAMLVKMFAVVFVAALVGSYGGNVLQGIAGPTTGQIVNQPAPVVPTPSPSPQPAPDLPSTGPIITQVAQGGQSQGSTSAPVVLVEFTDYQCPFCGRHFEQTYPTIKKNYIDTGKVEYIQRNFPLSFHEHAFKAAQAAECASEQGKFWEMHDLLFNGQADLSDANIDKFAATAGVDKTKFDACMASGKFDAKINQDEADGAAYGVSGTPSFFLAKRGGTAQKIVGAQPVGVFTSAIDALLAS